MYLNGKFTWTFRPQMVPENVTPFFIKGSASHSLLMPRLLINYTHKCCSLISIINMYHADNDKTINSTLACNCVQLITTTLLFTNTSNYTNIILI